MGRETDLRITAGLEVGFCVWEAGEVVAALTSASELAEWIERRLGKVPGEAERESRDRAEAIEALPNVISAVRDGGRGIWRRK